MPDDRAALHAVLRLDLASFVSKVYATVDASQPYHHNWHIEVLAIILTTFCRVGPGGY